MEENANLKKQKKIYIALMSIAILVIVCIGVFFVRNIIVHSKTAKLEEKVRLEKDKYNSQIKEYIGEQTKGNQVITMIEKITKINEENVNKENYFISIEVENIDNVEEKDKKELEEACQKCSFVDGEGENNNENVKLASNEMKNIRLKIHTAKQYKIEESYDNGLIYKIKIREL